MSAHERTEFPVHDIVGVGFGPANLALAIAVDEHNATAPAGDRVSAVFLERRHEFGWHRGMLIDGTAMQVAFLKDLATMRNPTSDYGFVPYLHGKGRLADFINQKNFFPSREEFHDYLSWAAARLNSLVRYGSEVTGLRSAGPAVEVVCAGPAPATYLARNVVLATGLRPDLPSGVRATERVWHSADLLHRLAGYAQARRFIVVGAGQSAAEATEYLHRRFPTAEICAVFTRYGYSPADDSPYANRIFDAGAVDDYFHAAESAKNELLAYHRNTNYSVVDLDLIEDLYRREYQEKVRGERRLRMINSARLTGLTERSDEVEVEVRHLLDGSTTSLTADAVVFATGYRPAEVRPILGPLYRHCRRDGLGRLIVDRDYRVSTTDHFGFGIYLQGGTEHSHGISSSLLSNVAVRAGEILDSVLDRRAARSGTLLRAA